LLVLLELLVPQVFKEPQAQQALLVKMEVQAQLAPQGL
jgi:hypothetical protein